MKIEAIHNHIVFEFLDRVTNSGEFEREKTQNGIELLTSTDNSAGASRWGRVISAGPDCCDELRIPNVEIFIDNLMWTKGVSFGGSTVWRTDDTHVGLYRIPDGSTTLEV